MFYERERIYKSDLGTNHLEFCVNLTALARELNIDQKSLLEFLDTHTALSIIRKAIVSEMEQKEVLCPICGYQLGQCQCRFGGSAHPDRIKKREVVLDHLYLLSSEQLQHVILLEKQWQTSYGDKERSEYLHYLESQCRG